MMNLSKYLSSCAVGGGEKDSIDLITMDNTDFIVSRMKAWPSVHL